MVEWFFKTNKTELLEKTKTQGEFMKYLLLFIMVWTMGGCATAPEGAFKEIMTYMSKF